MSSQCDRLREEIGGLFECSPRGDGIIKITTPFLYPDGDIIDLFYLENENGSTGTISDLGETVRWLHGQSISMKRSIGQRRLIDDVCLTTGVEFFKGRIQARVSGSHGDMANVLHRVAQASLRISDMWFTFRSRSIQTVNEEVALFLSEGGLPFEASETLVGRSGRKRLIDFHVRAQQRSSLVVVLSTGSRSAAHILADRALATWTDLNHLVVGPEALAFISLIDDTTDVWGEEDFRLIAELSSVARWSAPEEFSAMLKMAA